MVKFLIAADICPIGDNLPYFERGDAESLFGDLLPEFQSADLCVANLECPFIERPTPIRKTGPIFGAPGSALSAIKAGGFHALALANNHILDHGAVGLEHTLELCAREGIQTVGAGPNLTAARRILIRRAGTLRIGILAVAEHEFSIARDDYPGANPLDIVDFVRNVTENRGAFDYLVVLLHGSAEFHVPTPRIQDTCRFMIEMGAKAVIVQHPHCLGGFEEYHGGHIVYGQGALLMDEEIYRGLESFHEGFVVKLLIADDASSTMEIIPFVQSDPVPGARRMPPPRERKFRRALDELSHSVKDPKHVQREWLKFCDREKHSYISGLLGHNRVLGKLNKGGLLTRLLYGRQPLLGARNIVACETHREAVTTILDRQLLVD